MADHVPTLAEARRIVVLRGGGLGDVVFALPALEALRARAPDAEVTLVGEGWLAGLVVGRAAVPGGPALVDRLEPLPASTVGHLAGVPDPSGATDALVERLAATRPDIAVQLHGGGRHTNPFVASLGARLTAGLRTPDAVPLDRWVPYVYYQAEVFRSLEVVGLLGATPVSVEPRMAVSEAEADAARGAVPPGARPLAVLHPGASDRRRQWPVASFAALAQRLVRAGARVVVVGNDGDRPAADGIVEGTDAPGRVTSLAGEIDVPTLAGVVAAATVVIGNDSGPVHLARAVGSRTVGIYWCGNLVNAGPVWRTRHRPAIAWRLACPVCGVDCTREQCPHDASFVADVSVDEVASSALELLQAAGTRGAAGSPARS